MAPKKENGGTPSATDDVAILCIALMSSDGKVDTQVVGKCINQLPKNVPRKLNSIINPRGFELKAGRVIKIGEAEKAGDANQAEEADKDDDNDDDAGTPQKRKAGAAKKGRASKKTKVEEA